ncbi:MAG TPA: GldM family protein [Bacteroidales bacterium]|nr:GldM family protein [Bacteroidales bacterium]
MNIRKNYPKREFLIRTFTVLAFFTFAATLNAQVHEKDEIVAAVELTKMNVVYIGVDNPLKIAVSGYECSDLNVTITNGSIKGEKGEYIINPRRPGNMVLSVYANGKLVNETSFRVKYVPNPILMVAGLTGGDITKNHLLSANVVKVRLPDFDFDLSFKIKSFLVSATGRDGSYVEARSDSEQISDTQKEIIKNAEVGARINFEDISVIGPDGRIVKLSPVVFQIIE